MTINTISFYSVLAPTLVGVFLFKSLPRILKHLCILIFSLTAFEFLSLTANKYLGTNLFLFHLFTYIEFGVIATIYYSLSKEILWKRIVLTFTILFVLFSIINLTYFETFIQFNSNQRYVEGIMVLIFCIGYYTKLLREAENIYLEKHPYFWLTSGYLIYFAGTLFLFLFSRELMENSDSSYWSLHGMLNIFLNLIYVITLWLGSKASTTL